MNSVLVIPKNDPRYPPLLKQIKRPPDPLYVRGDVAVLQSNMVAVVGTRRCTPYGQQQAQRLSRGLASYQLTVVSGLAFGIDFWAHHACLQGNGKTVAVLGSAIDDIQPKRHQTLAEQILERGGAIISEYAPGTRCRAHHFPQRNRIISGLSIGTLVIEAPARSGSLITAKWALQQNRDVMTIPGDLSRGAMTGNFHLLANDMAALVRHPEDVIHRLHHQPDLLLQSAPTLKAKVNLDPPLETAAQHQIWSQLKQAPHSPEMLLKSLDCSLSEILVALTLFELQGYIVKDGRGCYATKSPE
jgi:DNA processing protein